jgi:hypothetical protein
VGLLLAHVGDDPVDIFVVEPSTKGMLPKSQWWAGEPWAIAARNDASGWWSGAYACDN